MKYYQDPETGAFWAYEDTDDESLVRPGLVRVDDAVYQAFLDEQAQANARAEQVYQEDQWRVKETAFVTDQLMAIEDGDPDALPGTEEQWRTYRTQVRAWKEGAANFPDPSYRPTRPTGA